MIKFYKYQGAGNDFIVLDGRTLPNLTEKQIAFLCDRRLGVGADGLMILLEKAGFDFEMKYFNADGKAGSLCGNGGRCLTRFAFDLGIKKDSYHFFAVDGIHEASINHATKWVHLKMNPVNEIEKYQQDSILNTGSPHYIQEVEDIHQVAVFDKGRKIRYNEDFAEKGINVNFVEVLNNGLWVRTYERGVEDETLSCGTGVTAAALVFAPKEPGHYRIPIFTRGGELAVECTRKGDQQFDDIWLCGPTTRVFEGSIQLNP